MEITSKDNERLKLYRRLSSDRRARKKEGLFVLEGARLVGDLAEGDILPEYILATEEGLKKYSAAMEKIISRMNREKIFLLSESAALSLSETKMSQGIYAVCPVPVLDKSAAYDKIGHGGKYIILDNVQDPGNLGTMLRTADACGIDAVWVCSCCDVYNPKTVRSAMGSIMRLCIIEDNFSEAVKALKDRGVPVYASVIDPEAKSIKDAGLSEGAAVIIGNEGSGIPPLHSALADGLITIKMKGRLNSLNAAMAAGIIMWEMNG